VGAGFGGLAVARGLAGVDVDVAIVDRNNFHTFQPLLYQVATAGLSGVDVGHAVRALFQHRTTCASAGRPSSASTGTAARSTWPTATASATTSWCSPGDPAVFVVGDVAAAAGTDGRPLPQLAPVAIQEGRHAARQICRRLEGRATTPFRYRDPGLMATIGRGAGVAELRSRLRFHGAPGWVAWLLLHLVILVGVRNRISVLVSWAWNYLTWDRAYRLIIELPTADRATARPGCRA